MGLIETFTTKNLPVVQRLEFWNSAASGFSPGLSISGLSDSFNGNLRCMQLGSLKLFWAMASASEVVRLPGRQGDERILVQVQNAGLCRQRHRAHDITLSPGDVSLCTTAAPFLQTADDHEVLVLDVDRCVLEQHVHDLDGRLGKLVPAGVAGAHSFHQLLLALWREMSVAGHGVPPAMLDGSELVLLDMLGVVLRSQELGDCVLTDSRTLRINQIIDQHLGESSLSPSFVANRLGVSLRTVQQWFAASGTTPRAYIQRRRLEFASTALRRADGPSITTIAIDHGFSDSAHFARCFHRHYGQYPRAYRNSDRGAGKA